MPEVHLGRRWQVALLALSLWAGAPDTARADEALTRQQERIINYAFATQLGSGVYDVNGRTVQIYRLPFAFNPRREAPGRVGVRVRIPVTVGFVDFEPIDVVNTGLPSHLDTASIVPGLELRFRVRENWLLAPAAELGIASDRSSETSAYVYSAGVRSVAEFNAGRFRLALGNQALYGQVDPRDHRPADDYFLFETSLEARHGMGFSIGDYEADYGLYAMQNLYFGDPHFPLRHAESSSMDDQYEVGVTFGSKEPAKLWKVPLPRLGIGYRFGEGVSVIRFVIGTPAPSLKR